MSTRSNIAIRLRDEDLNKTFETPWGEKVKPNGKRYLNVYCHNDGYPSGVGQDLKDMFDGADYEDALEYILRGDRSTTDLSYYEWRGETCPPCPEATEDDCDQQEYLYILEEIDGSGRIKVRQYGVEPALSNDEIRDMVEDWFYNNIGEYNLADTDLDDMTYDCYSEIDLGDTDETEEGDDPRDVICETLEALIEKELELAEDEEADEEETKPSRGDDEVYEVNSHGDMVGPKTMTVNSHGDIVYTDAHDWR